MKQPRKLTRNEKEKVVKKGLNPNEWMFLCDLLDDDGRPTSYFRIISKKSNKTLCVDRYLR